MADLDGLAIIAAALNAYLKDETIAAQERLETHKINKDYNMKLLNAYGPENINMDGKEWAIKTPDQGFNVRNTPSYKTNLAVTQDAA